MEARKLCSWLLASAQGVGRELEWRAVLGERLFREASDGGSAALGRLVDIFVERHHQLWKVRLGWTRVTDQILGARTQSQGRVRAAELAETQTRQSSGTYVPARFLSVRRQVKLTHVHVALPVEVTVLCQGLHCKKQHSIAPPYCWLGVQQSCDRLSPLDLQPQEVHQWLRGVCRAALLPGAATADGLTADDLQTVRAEVYTSNAANAYAHLRVAEYSDQIAALPPEVHGLPSSRPLPNVIHVLSA